VEKDAREDRVPRRKEEIISLLPECMEVVAGPELLVEKNAEAPRSVRVLNVNKYCIFIK